MQLLAAEKGVLKYPRKIDHSHCENPHTKSNSFSPIKHLNAWCSGREAGCQHPEQQLIEESGWECGCVCC